ncbi:MAG: hypothetical protein B7Z54_02600, partial [Sphingobacteriales bacterium 12-47-4]
MRDIEETEYRTAGDMISDFDLLIYIITDTENTLQAWADDLAQQLPDGATLLGWSLGGQVAMRAALDHPHKVARL